MDERIITERRPLGAATMAGDYLVRSHRRLACPHCGHIVRASDAREIPDGIAVTCTGCHVDIIVVEAL